MPHAEPDYTIHNAAWSGHHLILADEDVVDNKIRRPMLSPSIAGDYNSCPAKVVIARLQPWQDDPFAANSMGSAAHAVMEEVMLLPPDERTLERAYVVLEKNANEQWSIAKLEKQNDEHLRANAENRARWVQTLSSWIRMTFLAIDPPSIDVETTEFRLDNIEIAKGVGGADGIPLKGFVDLTEWVMRDGKKVRFVDDWKFGKAKVKVNPQHSDNYGDQQRTYVAGYTEKTGEAPAGARLIFPRGLEGIAGVENMTRRQIEALTIRNIDVSPNEMRKTLLGFRAGWNTMHESCDRRSFEARPSPLCAWCPAANSCPVARIGSKQNAIDAAASQPSALQLGIPTLRPGASLQEVRDAPGVTVPLRREPDFEAPIEADGDDLFPITLIDPDADEAPAPAAPTPSAPAAPTPSAPAGQDEPPFDPSYEPSHHGLYDAEVPDEIIPADTDGPAFTDAAEAAITAHQGALVGPDNPTDAEWFHAVHVGGEGHTTQGDWTNMNENAPEPQQVMAEAPPWEAEINGILNLNSYSAIAVSGLVAIAFEHMREQDVKVSPASLSKFAHVLSGVVLRVQKRTTGFNSFQSGANTRLRGFLHMALSAFPAPFRVVSADGITLTPATLDDWQAWIARLENLLNVSLVTAVGLYESAGQNMTASPEAYFALGGDGAPAPTHPHAVAPATVN